MNAIQNAYLNALFAEAAYVKFTKGMNEPDIRSALNEEALTTPQAQFIASNFEVLSAINTNDLMGSGFDAVVWRGRTGSEFAGQVFVSMRGTEPLGMDLFDADIDLATRGVAYNQIRDMVNWWMSATAKPREMVKQAAVFDTSTSVPMPEATGYITFVAGTPVQATHPALAQQWSNFDEHFSAEWLQDRSAMHGYVLQIHERDLASRLLPAPGQTSTYYEDMRAAEYVQVGNAAVRGEAGNQSYWRTAA